ncbi:MAG: serine/threonine protein kinase [Burkholderiales bacterium]|jgi:Ser/Thr protein kinase RdoA (MazF antagonist)|nr:serine/threonine protein kinase [Burkholderiales bacterium]MBP6250155.1 serine/threonine protein kinase [Leptothrix sp. (in: b-proteobacteria)]MBP7519365.1 serine/threonine protein kinase [Leptothrix sp. (in: b-proteobacteria)]HQY07797.1 serine/threonine protein kinase [Burkholderiaceae bacterium]
MAPSPRTPQSDDRSSRPYEGLTPHEVLDALDTAGLRGDGRILQLNSYENRVFQVHLEDGRIVVAKFYRAGRWSDAQILEEHTFARELAEAEVPAVAPLTLEACSDDVTLAGDPPTLARRGPWRFAASPRCGGRSPEVEQPEVLEWIGRFLARLHEVGVRQPFEHRLRIDGSANARAALDWLLEHDILPPTASASWRQAAETALDAVDAAFDRHGGPALLRLHGDCHIGNLLWTPEGPHFVDLDDAVTGPAVQDLWMLLGGDRQEMQAQLGALLDGYETMRDFDRRELALIEPLRTLRIIQHSAWIARRWDDPAFPIAFPSFESPAYWDQQAMLLGEQIEAMQGPALVA